MEKKLGTKHGRTSPLLCSSAYAAHSCMGSSPSTDKCAQLVALVSTPSSYWNIPALAALHILTASGYKASPGLRPQQALLHASPLPIHGPFHHLRCLTQKKEKSQYYRCVDTHHHFFALGVLSSTEGVCTQNSIKGKAVSALPALPGRPREPGAKGSPGCPLPARAALPCSLPCRPS